MNAWAQRHRDAIEASLEAGEQLVGAERVIVVSRRRRAARRDLPRGGFVLAVTDRRLLALEASRWLARPGGAIASWPYVAGYGLGRPSRSPLAWMPLVLPDLSVIRLAPYGGRSLRHLATDQQR